jgi:predicted nucleic acid-binding protein
MSSIIVDTQILLLFVVGNFDSRHVARHRRLSSDYSVDDYERLFQFVGNFDRIVVTPNSLTEVSNLISDSDDPDAIGIKKAFCLLISDALEVYTPSKDVARSVEFAWLGLSDAAQILVACDQGHVFLTGDGPLHSAALRRGVEAVHFSALRA